MRSDTQADLLDAVQSDPGLSGEEWCFTMNAVYSDDELGVFAEIPALVRGLIQNPQFVGERWRLWREDEVRYPTDRSTVVDLVGDGWAIVAIEGSLPFAALKLKATTRSRDGFFGIVATG